MKKPLVVALTLGGLTLPTLAQTWYVGADAGLATHHYWPVRADDQTTLASSSSGEAQLSQKNIGLSVLMHAGRRDGNLAWEAILGKPGSFSAKISDSTGARTLNATLKGDYTVLGGALAGFFPMGKTLELTGKIGLLAVSEKITYTATQNFVPETSFSSSNIGGAFLIGVGVANKLDDQSAITYGLSLLNFALEKNVNGPIDQSISIFSVGYRRKL